MTARFAGWPERAFEVLLQLEGDPSADVRERWRAERVALVHEPMVALCHHVADMEPAYNDFYVWSIHTDPWLWQHQCGGVRLHRRVEYFLRFDLDGLMIEGGWTRPVAGQVDRFRKAVTDDATGEELTVIADRLVADGYELDGDRMRRPPRGTDPEHPRADLLAHRSLLARRHLGDEGWLHTAEAADRVLATLAELRPLMAWLGVHAAAGAPPA